MFKPLKYRIFKVTYTPPEESKSSTETFYYIAMLKEHVIAYSKKYADFEMEQTTYGGSIWITEVFDFAKDFNIENINDFTIEFQNTKSYLSV